MPVHYQGSHDSGGDGCPWPSVPRKDIIDAINLITCGRIFSAVYLGDMKVVRQIEKLTCP